jgi:hypothetical protein
LLQNTFISSGLIITANAEAMTSKGLRSDTLSTDTKLYASHNVGLTTKTFIGYRLCYMPLLFIVKHLKLKYGNFII